MCRWFLFISCDRDRNFVDVRCIQFSTCSLRHELSLQPINIEIGLNHHLNLAAHSNAKDGLGLGLILDCVLEIHLSLLESDYGY